MPRRLSRRARRLRRSTVVPLWCIATLAVLLLGVTAMAAGAADHPDDRRVGVASLDDGDDGAPARPPLPAAPLPGAIALAVALVVSILVVASLVERDAPRVVVARLRGPPPASFVPHH